jgi:RING finger/CHY zinc finger protein 1
MRPTWDALAFAIRLQPVPSEYVKVVTIFCNDCEKKGIHRPWHFLGVQCIECLSFNTSIVETELSGEAAVAFLRGSESHENL